MTIQSTMFLVATIFSCVVSAKPVAKPSEEIEVSKVAAHYYFSCLKNIDTVDKPLNVLNMDGLDSGRNILILPYSYPNPGFMILTDKNMSCYQAPTDTKLVGPIVYDLDARSFDINDGPTHRGFTFDPTSKTSGAAGYGLNNKLLRTQPIKMRSCLGEVQPEKVIGGWVYDFVMATSKALDQLDKDNVIRKHKRDYFDDWAVRRLRNCYALQTQGKLHDAITETIAKVCLHQHGTECSKPSKEPKDSATEIAR